MPTPGLLYIQSRPKPNWPEDKYNKWYSDFHIDDVINAGIGDLAIRFRNTNPKAEWPYLAIYRLTDVTVLQDRARVESVPATHELLPEGSTWRDAIEMDMRVFSLVQKFEGQIPKEGPRGKALRTVMVEPADDEEFDEWYRKQHLDMLSMVRGYRRSTRYKLEDPENKAGHPRFLACHEYDTADFPVEQVKLVTGTEWSKKILGQAKSFGGDVWEQIAQTGAVDSKL